MDLIDEQERMGKLDRALFVCLLSICAPFVPSQAIRPMKDRVVH
jgi:hypothetical protein